MALPKAAPVTASQRATLIDAARRGLSFTGCAHMIGRSRAWLSAARANEPDLDEDMLRSMAEYEDELTVKIGLATEAGDAKLISALVGLRANRFPQRHGNDPRLRYATEVAGDEHAEDLPRSQAQVSDSLGNALQAALDWAYANEGKPKE